MERDGGGRGHARLARAGDHRAVLRAGGCLLFLAGCAMLATGCSAAKATSDAGATCGTTRTGADVPVVIKIAKGTVNCGTALRVENEYAAKIRDGQVRGNGGGAPVTVGAWTCQGYATPEVLSTGNASQCHTSGAAILAVLAVPNPRLVPPQPPSRPVTN